MLLIVDSFTEIGSIILKDTANGNFYKLKVINKKDEEEDDWNSLQNQEDIALTLAMAQQYQYYTESEEEEEEEEGEED